MSKKIITINKELSLPINSFSDKTMLPDELHREFNSMLTVEIDLDGEDFPFSLPSDIFIHCNKYYSDGSVSLLQILKDEEEVYQTTRYNRLADINIQFDTQDELSCFLIFYGDKNIQTEN